MGDWADSVMYYEYYLPSYMFENELKQCQEMFGALHFHSVFCYCSSWVDFFGSVKLSEAEEVDILTGVGRDQNRGNVRLNAA